MAIKQINGNIFNSKCQTIVNTVNCVGVMGKGIALVHKLRYPNMYEEYREHCENKLIKTCFYEFIFTMLSILFIHIWITKFMNQCNSLSHYSNTVYCVYNSLAKLL